MNKSSLYFDKGKNTSKRSFPLVSMLLLIFITLKLIPGTTISTWSWWWVLSPLWGPFVLIIGLTIFAVICMAILQIIASIQKK